MNWFIIIPLVVLTLTSITLVIIELNQQNLFFQVLYAFLCSHDTWKKYRRLKKYLKNNTIPVIGLQDCNNAGFAFVQCDSMIFIIQGNNIYLSSYYSHLIKNLLKHNNYDS